MVLSGRIILVYMHRQVEGKMQILKTINIFLLILFFSGCKHGEIVSEISDVSKKPSSLTLMIYMAADNDLESYAIQNLKQMEKAVCSGINVLVLFDRAQGYDETNGNWTDTRLFELCHDDSQSALIVSKRLSCPPLGIDAQSETELDMSKALVLKSFVEYVKDSYKAEQYALIIWGHGTGWRYMSQGTESGGMRAVAIDDKSGSYMSLCELSGALANQGINVIGFDTCFGGTIETVYELKDSTQFVTASAGLTPGTGWDYTKLLESLSQSDCTPLFVARAMMQSSNVCASVFDCTKLEELASGFEDFSRELACLVTDSRSQKDMLQTMLSCKSYSYSQYPCDLFLDIYSLTGMYSRSQSSNLSNAALALEGLLKDTVISSDNENPQVSVHFVPMTGKNTVSGTHNTDYLKNNNNTDQCAFIKQSRYWVPTSDGNSGSVLDKLFYTQF